MSHLKIFDSKKQRRDDEVNKKMLLLVTLFESELHTWIKAFNYCRQALETWSMKKILKDTKVALKTDIHANFFLNNQTDTLIILIYSFIKLYMFRASSLPIIRSHPPYIPTWQVSCRFLMTASKQSQDGTAVPSWLCLEPVIINLHETCQVGMYGGWLLMMGKEDAWNM